MTRPRLLDLFSGAGGAAVGYHRAGFDVVGVDIAPQPRYPFEFVQADAMQVLAYLADDAEPWPGAPAFDAIHASPPCQAYSTVSGRARKGQRAEYPDLVEPSRALLAGSGRPWVMENVEGAPLASAFRLCGSSFGLNVRRHRLFETGGWLIPMVPPCAHHWQRPRFRSLDSRQQSLASVIGVHGHTNYAGEQQQREQAMGIDWMSPYELTQAIPPDYTQFIGEMLAAALTTGAAAA